MFESLQTAAAAFSSLAWGPWLLVLLLGGGAFFLLYSGFVPFRHLRHAYELARGRYDDVRDPGQITHFQALSTAMAGTIGMGNIGGVALAISLGGPGAIFWMWITAVLGIATKFFTCSLAVMYRGLDSAGELQGGPMYVIREALPKLSFLAVFFCIVGSVGALPAFQANQLVQILREVLFIPNGWLPAEGEHLGFNALAGGVLAALTAAVIFGGISRIAAVAASLVPIMSALYLGAALVALGLHAAELPALLGLIVQEAFSGSAVAGGTLGSVIIVGVQRGAYSNEAGIGTESLVHGAARTHEPIRQGLVAMLGPIVDTLLICTATALLILLSGVWQTGDANGVTLTARAFEELLGTPGLVILFVCVLSFATTTIFTYSYYGAKCFSYLAGAERTRTYLWLYVAFIVVAAVIPMEAAINLIDGAFALMAIPTMISALLLAPKVKTAAAEYFDNLRDL
jgi:AGCS family alanine or glycine:cation symporter